MHSIESILWKKISCQCLRHPVLLHFHFNFINCWYKMKCYQKNVFKRRSPKSCLAFSFKIQLNCKYAYMRVSSAILTWCSQQLTSLCYTGEYICINVHIMVMHFFILLQLRCTYIGLFNFRRKRKSVIWSALFFLYSLTKL